MTIDDNLGVAKSCLTMILSCILVAYLIGHIDCQKYLQDCNIEEATDEEEPPPSKSSKDKKANGPDSGKGSSLVFKITSKVPYKTVLKGKVT